MKLFLISSTRPSGFVQTDIFYRLDEDPVHKITEDLSEPPALLTLMTGIVQGVECGSTLEVHSKRNAFTNPYKKGWMPAWKKDGFRTKPKKCRREWKQFDEIVEHRRIRLDIHIESDAGLKAVLYPRHPDRPGTPAENPWAKPESSDDMLRRALEKPKKPKNK